jgi:hypothetical protein
MKAVFSIEMTPNPSLQYLTISVRIGPFAAVGVVRGLAFESANRRPGNSPLKKGFHEWLLRRSKGWNCQLTNRSALW